jgi:hypothetical protein
MNRDEKSIQKVRKMAKHHNTSVSLKSISGGTLIGLGLHVLSGNLSGDAMQFRHMFDIPAGDALGLLPSMMLAASQAVNVYSLDHGRFVDWLLYVLASLWPILPVIFGTVLLRNALTDKVKVLPPPDPYVRNKYFQNKGAACRFRCPSFDV